MTNVNDRRTAMLSRRQLVAAGLASAAWGSSAHARKLATADEDLPRFPPGFAFGAATSAYQIEGAVDEGGRGISTWDRFCAEPGRIKDGSSGAVADDHYHRFAGDVALMKALGLTHYRFSIAWPRIVPTGSGAANPAGLDFYDRLIDALLAAGIKPAVTLFHWDTPAPLEDAGGWMARDTALRFADYAAIAGRRYADRVAMWMPLNEPLSLTSMGYMLGLHAPGKQLGMAALAAAHHQLLGHGLAVAALRAAGATSIGIANNHAPIWPASAAAEDRTAAQIYDDLTNWTFVDPLLAGTYPDSVAAMMPVATADDLKIIAAPLDWYGVNYYNPTRVGAPDARPVVVDGATVPANPLFSIRDIAGYPLTDFGWPVVPAGLGEMLARLQARYGAKLPPVYITENGCSYGDGPGADGRVRDARRIAFYRDHLAAVQAAIAQGIDVRGYFAWSLMDNFEWAAGYGQRFGLVHVDYATQKRTPKDSFHWYRTLIAKNRAAA